jgi:hypothetical protein
MARVEIPWNWFRPGPERDAARARDRKRRLAALPPTPARAKAKRPALTLADRDDDIRRLWREGWSGVRIARRFGLAKSTVSEIIDATGSGTARPLREIERSEIVWPHPRRRFRSATVGDRPPPPGASRPSEPGDKLGARETPRGSAHGRAKLNEAKVARIKRLRLEGWTTGMLAREFEVGRNTVCYVLNGKTWGDVEAAPTANGGNPC